MAENTIKDVKLKIGTETQFQSKLKDLPINILVGTTDPIQEGELDTSIITKLNKAENALPKPTNGTTGSVGDVLSKTANGSEWKTIKVLPTTTPNEGDVLMGQLDGTPAWVGGVLFEIYTHYMSFTTASGETVTLTKTSSYRESYANLASAYQREFEHFQHAVSPMPVVGTILSGGQHFSAVALNSEGTILYGEGGTEIDISDMTEWSDTPLVE